VKNSRGVWDLDTTKGCLSGVGNNPNGCYGDCYAYRSAVIRGFNFGQTVTRHFENEHHEYSILNQINKIDMPFVRIGVAGDPSENWDHTVNVCEKVTKCNMVLYSSYKKAIVIITKHWGNLTDNQLKRLSLLGVCINTSVSALDKNNMLRNRLTQYNRLKEHCKSVLRIVSCNFNLQNETGAKLNLIQDKLFDNENVLDTVLRVGKNNELVLNGVINIEKVKFLSQSCYASRRNKNTYFGKCSTCPEMCGLTL
jgi:hypothetical protein